MDYEVRDEQPTINGLIVRSVDSMGGRFKDLDTRDGRHRVLVEFPHERVDTYKTTFAQECFRRSFEDRLPVMCWQHDLRDPIGRAEKAQVLRAANELTGVFSDFNAVPQAARAHSQIEDKTLTDFSFGFRDPIYQRHPDFRGVRRINEATMKEFSPVTIGSIPGAVATGIREEDVMDALTIDNILRLRDSHMISDEDAQQALKNIAGLEHITILSSTNGGDDRAPAPYSVKPGETVKCPNCGKMNEPDAKFCDQCGHSLESRSDDELPETIGPAEVFGALPEPFQRAIAEAEARLFLVVGDEEWGPLSETRSVDDHALELLTKIDAACRSGVEWLADTDVETLAPELRQAIALFQAAGVGAEALLDTFDADHSLRDDADMALPVRAIPDDAPKGSKVCPTCNGSGKIRAGHVTCPDCNGKGWLTPERADDIASTRAIPDDWSTKPWENINPSDYTPEQLKRAALVSTGDAKGDQHLPIREPDGTINVNAVQAAAGRLNQTSSLSGSQKAEAANKLAALYDQMGRDLPDNVKKFSTRAAKDDDEDEQDGDDSNDDSTASGADAASDDKGATDEDTSGDDAEDEDEEDESKRQRAMARLDRHQRPRA